MLRPIPNWVGSRPIGRAEAAIVLRNVATLVSAGLPVERAMAATEPIVSPRLGAQIGEARRLIRDGASVAHALEAFPRTFPRAVVGIIRAGERGSSLADACEAAADELEEAARIAARVRAALAYPALILMVGGATITVMGTVVVPRFAELLTSMGAELPPATRVLVAVASALRRFGLLLAILVASLVLVLWRAVETPRSRELLDHLLLRLPIVGAIRHAFASARLCRALGGMLERGMPLLAALDAARDAPGDAEVSRRLGIAREAVVRGSTLTSALDAARSLDRGTLQLVGVGESSGRLGPMVRRAGEVTGERAERTLRTAVALMEPMLVLALGVVVAAVAAALLQAVYSVRPL
jgi:general secretion pathway protein F